MKLLPSSQVIPNSIQEVLELLIKNRNILSTDSFLNPPHPVSLTADMVLIDEKNIDESVKIIKNAIEKKVKIVIYGDYDADGICATALLWETLFSCWQSRHADVSTELPSPFIPHRMKHGYGLSTHALDEIIKKHDPKLIITVDTGIVAHAEVEYLKKRGVDCIITDHHEPELDADGKYVYPNSKTVIHSTKLCGTTVAWFLARALTREYALPDSHIEKQLDLCGLATIADQVPLLDYNRSFAYHGLKTLIKLERVGLRELLSISTQGKTAKISETTIGFTLAPKINAMGRLDNGLEALRLLCTKQVPQARKLSQLLTQTNQDRQVLTADQLTNALKQAEEQVAAGEHIILVHSTEYHEGIIGLIASQLTERFYLPSIAVAVQENLDTVKASARSIPGVHITELLRKVRSDLTAVGGHPMAAGFSAKTVNLQKVITKIHQIAKDSISIELLEPSQIYDCELPGELISTELCKELQKLAPFGAQNSAPLFFLKSFIVLSAQTIGADSKHLKLLISDPTGKNLVVMGWSKGTELSQFIINSKIDLVVSLENNQFRSVVSVQATLKWWRNYALDNS